MVGEKRLTAWRSTFCQAQTHKLKGSRTEKNKEELGGEIAREPKKRRETRKKKVVRQEKENDKPPTEKEPGLEVVEKTDSDVQVLMDSGASACVIGSELTKRCNLKGVWNRWHSESCGRFCS